MAECLFCQIAAGVIPSTTLYADDDVYAFNDIAPKAPIHVLVIPRQHIATLSEADSPVLLGTLLDRVRHIADEVLQLQEGYRVVINVRAGGGQEVFHLHAHILGGRVLPF
ncbi:MAG: histidine triad nucleotide-binding protein [Mariprofundales bacterium]|nr:histidine triad nucleotide-binding protein [Mariprofundales bacterium]